MREDACVRTCQPDYIWSEKLKDWGKGFFGSKRTKKPLPFFLITLPRNAHNSKIFDLTHLSYLQVRVEGYLVRGITQCFNCNNFYHTAANCHMQPRCLKCGKNHATRNCLIKERQENPFCINCQDYGHSACYTKCPKFPQPKKEPLSETPRKSEISPLNGLKREFPSLTLLAAKSPIRFLSMTKRRFPHGFLSQDSNNTSDLTQPEVKLKKIDQLQRKIEELKELLFGLETAKPTEEAEFEEDLYKCETRLDDLEEGRVTTSTRIVFDAASHQANELSLNDCLWPGPNLNPNLLDVLINFRLNRVAISSDIRQAFLQICLADKHKDFVRFLWTDSNPRIGEKLTLQVYRFNRVIFGVNSSPFLLAATIKYHIEKYNEIHPITVQHLDSFMYVDDWITGQDTREEALFMSRHAKNIMKEAGMEMRKWISNDSVLMAQWAAEGFDTHPMDASIRLGTNKTKVLGMAWQTLDDCLTLDTKELWIKKITWDEILPPKLKEEWLIWCKELPLLDNLRIPRLVLDSTNDEVSDLIEIHIFCDASKLAYGAAAYVKVRKQNEVLVNLITSKTRVAPLKAVTLPRLELLGALVAARLSSRVQEIVRKKKECKVFHWTDSKIVLFWIKGSSKRWKQFVANRVQEISELTDPDSWFHCSGQDNPSDFLSRGLSVDTLISNNKWWTGPAFLRTDELPKTVSECPELNEVDYLPELKSKDSKEHTVLTLNFNQTFFDHLLSRSNKFLTIVRVLSFLYRFLFNIRNPTNKKTGPLTSDEMKEAEIYLMKQVQLSSFYKEIRAMQNGDDICNKSKILNLSPFLDDKGIIRVGGRLKHSRLPYSSKHPILLPAKSKLTIIIVKYYHEKYFHLGPQHLLYQVRLKYWPIHGRNICRKVVHNCVICFKFNPKICSQKMGDLPKERITPGKVFNSTGIDLCGPFFIKNKYQRKGPEIKVYVCIFICLVTKAIHLEIISDLTSQALIAALKRFISRRGKCHKIFSDNGTNMIGANREIKALSKLVRDREESLFAFFAEEGIEWSFIPPRSPNWGGLWEANIKSLKYHFKRVAGNSKFSYEELLTLITQIEAILNSRPLTPLSSDVDDLEVLTPAHFLIGRPITAIVEPSLLQCESNRLNVWQRIIKSVQTIWKRWSLSYLNSLQQRKKWIVNKENLKLGDMVLIREENLPPCKWLLGRVVKIYMGKDKKVRVVDIKTGKSIYKRSINRLSILPIEN
ncbi:integrase catalytic domain-containing protein [Trichonephila clavipes]|nr:integrase catalytic domain-containing protein [Trichonephila clavipes]